MYAIDAIDAMAMLHSLRTIASCMQFGLALRAIRVGVSSAWAAFVVKQHTGCIRTKHRKEAVCNVCN